MPDATTSHTNWWKERSDALNKADEVWPEPQPLQGPSLPASVFPIDALMRLADVAKGIQKCTQAPLALCAASVLSAANFTASCLVDVKLWGQLDGPVSLFILTQGVSGERKSSVDRLAMAGVYQWEKSLIMRWKSGLVSEDNAEGYDASHPPCLIVSDGTLQGIEIGMATGHATRILSSDEGGRFLGGHGLKQENFQQTISGLSSLWDGKPIKRQLKGQGKSKGELIIVNDARLCLHLLAQPIILQEFLSSTLLKGQGLAARLLVHAPESTIGTRFETVEQFQAPSQSGHVLWFAGRIQELLAKAPIRDAITGSTQRRALSLTDDAAACYVDFLNEIEARQGKGGDLFAFINLINKMPEMSGRIAATLAAFHEEETVTEHCMQAAIQMTRYFLAETTRLSQTAELSVPAQNAAQLAEWLSGEDRHNRLRNGAHKSIIIKSGPAACRKKAGRDDAIHMLLQSGWVKIKDDCVWLNPTLNLVDFIAD